MRGPPCYFEAIREQASRRWDQLEADPELAAPWHLLFKQIQSPRHVLSELLQNADDAGATEAAVSIEDGTFVFRHNGHDFTEAHFASLCRFGYSNKRALHTIGFRGVGFKCTFSLGDQVELFTPTLAVAFDRARFTEPKWIDRLSGRQADTLVRVTMKDPHRGREIEKNLGEWLQNPVSLLFFKSLRSLRVCGQPINWRSMGPGPVPHTEWMSRHDDGHDPLLIVRSEAEQFPEEAVREIREERLLRTDEERDFPPCQVELVLNEKGQLYVVLPTGVESELPFACNAPFIQDPARVKIKDPETSPTNRWLLKRAGALAASTMLLWLEQKDSSLADRAQAYELVPDVDSEDHSIAGTCGSIVEDEFKEALEDRRILLISAGDLKRAGQSVILPDAVHEVWPGSRSLLLLDPQKRPSLSPHVSEADRQKLVRWGVVKELSKREIFDSLQTVRMPSPKTWTKLLILWSYVGDARWHPPFVPVRPSLCIVPVNGRDELFSGDETVRFSENRLLQSEADWNFLASHLLVLDQHWPLFLAKQGRVAESNGDEETSERVETAIRVLGKVELKKASDVSSVIDRVAGAILDEAHPKAATFKRLAQIAAKLDVVVGDSFRYMTRDRQIRTEDDVLLYDADGNLESLLPEEWVKGHVLHGSYANSFDSCTQDEWNRWVLSGRAGLSSFVPLSKKRKDVCTEDDLQRELVERGSDLPDSYPFTTNSFVLEDWDFDERFWEHWTDLARADDGFWGRLVERVLAQPASYWSETSSANVLQKSFSGATRSITNELVLSGWILKLRSLRCLPDTRGFYRVPSDLLRRTPETEPLLDVEPFIHGRLDTEATRPLLELLGVRDVPTGPGRILQCLRALAKAEMPPAHEVQKWYERLDQLLTSCSSEEFAEVIRAFHDEKIVFTHEAGWVSASGAFLSADEEDAPGAALVFAPVRDLMLWRKVGIAERPSVDLVIRWLKLLPSGGLLSPDDARRVRTLTSRHPFRIHAECGHWLNLARQWVPVDSLEYSLTMQSLVEWGHLYESVKQRTADLLRLPGEITMSSPFSDWPLLADQIEEHLTGLRTNSSPPERLPWLNALGAGLRRVILGEETQTSRIRRLAADLEETVGRSSPELEVIPYLDGAPAGTPRSAEVVWLDKVLYIKRLANARLARLVPDRLGLIFASPEITAALSYCYGRSTAEVTEYLEENFELEPVEFIERVPVDGLGQGDATSAQAGGDVCLSLTGSFVGAESRRDRKHGEGDPPELDELDSTFGSDSGGSTVRTDPAEPAPPPVSSRLRPAREPIIERYARSRGFEKEEEGRFRRTDGSVLGRFPGELFPWVEHNTSGETVRHYWLKELCLEREPLELDVEIWGMIRKFPESHALVLANPEGEPFEFPGTLLCELIADQRLRVYPATYRLVLHMDGHE